MRLRSVVRQNRTHIWHLPRGYQARGVRVLHINKLVTYLLYMSYPVPGITYSPGVLVHEIRMWCTGVVLCIP